MGNRDVNKWVGGAELSVTANALINIYCVSRRDLSPQMSYIIHRTIFKYDVIGIEFQISKVQNTTSWKLVWYQPLHILLTLHIIPTLHIEWKNKTTVYTKYNTIHIRRYKHVYYLKCVKIWTWGRMQTKKEEKWGKDEELQRK